MPQRVRSRPKVRKSSFYLVRPDGSLDKRFVRSAYQPLDSESPVIIQYLGDEKLSTPFSHGNSTKQTKLFFTTQKSVMRNIQQQVKTKDSHVVYKEMVAKRGDDITEKPRNPKQVANIKFKVDKEKRLSHDALFI